MWVPPFILANETANVRDIVANNPGFSPCLRVLWRTPRQLEDIMDMTPADVERSMDTEDREGQDRVYHSDDLRRRPVRMLQSPCEPSGIIPAPGDEVFVRRASKWVGPTTVLGVTGRKYHVVYQGRVIISDIKPAPGTLESDKMPETPTPVVRKDYQTTRNVATRQIPVGAIWRTETAKVVRFAKYELTGQYVFIMANEDGTSCAVTTDRVTPSR